MNYKAVLFDLDGTLLDTLEDIARSMNAVLTNAGFPAHPVEAYRGLIGEGIANLVRRALPERGVDERTVQQHVSAMIDEYGRRWAEHTRPYPEIPELLHALTVRKFKMAVLSNKMDSFTRDMVKNLLADWQFEEVLGAQPSIPRKPDPTGALLISRQCGVRPEEFLYLGDSNTDMQTAVNAGMYPVGALWGFQMAEQLLAAGAQKLIAKPMELLTLFSDC
jgi:phosphoglycolate phosphatase